MKLNYLWLSLTVIFLSACSNPTPAISTPKPPVGSHSWQEWVSQKTGVWDVQGHGPSIGTDEWCVAVHFRVYGQRVPVEQTCTDDWNRLIDAKLH